MVSRLCRYRRLSYQYYIFQEVPKVTFYDELGLSARDLRFQHSFMMTARNCKMIIRIQDLKAVICQNALLLIDSNPDNSSPYHEKFYSDLPVILTENKLHSKHLPFEYKVLEVILSHSVDTMKAVMEELEPEIIELLDTLTNPTNMDIDQALVHVLLEYTVRLNRFSTGIKEYCQMLDDLLEVEEDLRDMCISVEPSDHMDSPTLYTAFVFTPSIHDESRDTSRDSHMRNIKQSHRKYKINLLDEMELLLDSYLKEGEDIANRVSELKQAIDDSNSAILINLDSHRNLLLRLELQLSMGMFACTWACIIGVAFGMNLNSSLEEKVPVFWAVTGFMYLSAGVAWRLLFKTITKRRQSSFSKAWKGERNKRLSPSSRYVTSKDNSRSMNSRGPSSV